MNERLPSRREFTPSATIFRRRYPDRSRSHPECTAVAPAPPSAEYRYAFSHPPEKPTFTERVSKSSGIFKQLNFFFHQILEVKAVQNLFPAVATHRIKCRLQENWLLTPGISTGYWKAIKMPSPARSSGDSASKSLPLNSTVPLVTS